MNALGGQDAPIPGSTGEGTMLRHPAVYCPRKTHSKRESEGQGCRRRKKIRVVNVKNKNISDAAHRLRKMKMER